MTKVPFLDISAATAELELPLTEAIGRVVRSGWYIQGQELMRFEKEFSAYVGMRSAVGVGNGLDALTLSLRVLGIGPGDEVIVPGQTFVATWLAVSAVGAVPVPVDVDPVCGLMDPSLVAPACGSRTRAVIAVDLFGHPFPLASLERLAKYHGLVIVNDAAQSHGAVSEKPDVSPAQWVRTWSFYPGKNLGALGDGGAVTTEDPGIAERLMLLRNYGSREKYVHETVGVNSRLDELQAAVLRVKLTVLDEWNERRRALASFYLDALADLPIQLPPHSLLGMSAWHLFVIRLDARDDVQRFLAERGIGTLVHYPTIPSEQPAFVGLGLPRLPVSSDWAARSLSLPMGPHVSSAEALAVVEALREYFG